MVTSERTSEKRLRGHSVIQGDNFGRINCVKYKT